MKHINGAMAFLETQNITVSNNIIANFVGGILLSGKYGETRNTLIEDNIFLNGTGTGINIYYNSINTTISRNNFTELNDICIDIRGEIFCIKNNIINRVKSAIKYYRFGSIDFGFPKPFIISGNNISNCIEDGIILKGTIGGEGIRRCSVICENIFYNIGGSGLAGRLRITDAGIVSGELYYTYIYRNAFLECKGGSTSWGSFGKPYYFSRVYWDDGKWGNYWDSYDGPDEDNNLIGDKRFIISSDYGQYDRAPLLSLDLVLKADLGSTHPGDLTLLRSDLKTRQLVWRIVPSTDVNVSVFVNDIQMTFSKVNDIVNVSLADLSISTYNITLYIRTFDNKLYRDLVWVKVLPDEDNSLEFMTVFLIIVFIAIALGISFILLRRIKR